MSGEGNRGSRLEGCGCIPSPTGRLVDSELPLQQVPVRTKAAREIRNVFVLRRPLEIDASEYEID